MSIVKAEELLDRSQSLRAELKAWERQFAASNQGQKAGREDIKKNAEIASKYKEYNNLRDVLSDKAPVARESSPSRALSKKRKSIQDDPPREIQTPKRHKLDLTPAKSLHPAVLDPYDSPSVIRNPQFTPGRRAIIGPTPQRDGKVLGLFDLMDEDEDNEGGELGKTPSKSTPLKEVSLDTKDHRTPRKSHTETILTPLRYGRTPASSSKRYLLDMFVTPSKRKLAEYEPEGEDDDAMKTPAFLRRDQRPIKAPRYDENGNLEFDSPVVVCRPVKPPIRGLSSIIAGLRKMEEEKLDEEMDVLRDIENESSTQAGGKAVREPDTDNNTQGLSANGPRGEHDIPHLGDQIDVSLSMDDKEEEEQNHDDQTNKPSKPWKKRGQKRTTKRVIIRPSRTKPTKHSNAAINPTTLNLTEPSTNPMAKPNLDPNTDSQSQHQSKPKAAKGEDSSSSKPENLIQKTVRKISSTAHANFRKLKIKNRGASKGGGGKRRFGRR